MNHTSAALNMFLGSGITQVALFPILDFYLQGLKIFHNLGFSVPFLSCSTSCIDDLIVCRFRHDGVNLFLIPREFIELRYSSLTFVTTPIFEI